jgi:hypothetical protein
MNNRIEYVKTVPMFFKVSDNFAPALHSFIAEKMDNGVLLKYPLRGKSAYTRFVSWNELDMMIYGV